MTPRSVLLLDVALVALALGACRGARSPEPADLASYRDALAIARTSLRVSLALCATRPPAKVEACAEAFDALAEAVLIGDEVLRSVEVCAQAEREVCVSQATETARERLPELLRLLGRETAPASSGGGS